MYNAVTPVWDSLRLVPISTHTKIGTPHEKAPITVQMEVNYFHQCLSTIVSKLSTWDLDTGISKNLSWIQALYVGGRGFLTVSLVLEKL